MGQIKNILNKQNLHPYIHLQDMKNVQFFFFWSTGCRMSTISLSFPLPYFNWSIFLFFEWFKWCDTDKWQPLSQRSLAVKVIQLFDWLSWFSYVSLGSVDELMQFLQWAKPVPKTTCRSFFVWDVVWSTPISAVNLLEFYVWKLG